MKKIITLILLIIPSLIFSQSFTGKITNKYGKPIPNALIRNLNQGSHTHSNQLGEYILKNASIGDSLEMSHLGYYSTLFVLYSNSSSNLILKEKQISLEEVEIFYQKKPLQTLADLDLKLNPVKSSQEVLRKVPGLFIGQHAGGGKAEQIFLRGFDIDHGTDISLSVDGMPVNMVSHAHGQGYSDLHFLIPETIETLDFGKGPYSADKGNFSTAGYVDFKTKEKLESSQIGVEVGQFQTFRTLGLINLLDNQPNHHAYIASEFINSDGPFESPQNFHRLNILGKYSYFSPDGGKLSVSVSHFNSEWTASGQIPQRAVNQGLITRFGTIDDTEGGATSRTNVQFSQSKILNQRTSIKNNFFYSSYDFELFSNFTFFHRDPINGDQIRQYENRDIWGGKSEVSSSFFIGKLPFDWKSGIGFRFDDINDNELAYTLNRKQTLDYVQLGDVNETNLFAYSSGEVNIGNWTINPGLRVDLFNFQYQNQLDSLNKIASFQAVTLSPKLNLFYRHSRNTQFYFKSGKSFHSNDSRLVIAPNSNNQALPAAYGTDLGGIFRLSPKLIINSALWYLHLDQEFVYVGDEGIVEPSGRTRRMGIDFGANLQLGNYWFLNGNVNYAFARSLDDEIGSNYIPLAPDLTAVGSLSFKHSSGISAAIHSRFLKSRPANEDNSIVAKGYFITDLNANYQWKNIQLGLVIENLFNQAWNETQFATESRLRSESESIEEIHFTPGTPFFAKIQIRFMF